MISGSRGRERDKTFNFLYQCKVAGKGQRVVAKPIRQCPGLMKRHSLGARRHLKSPSHSNQLCDKIGTGLSLQRFRKVGRWSHQIEELV